MLLDAEIVIDLPGLYHDVSDTDYHRDPVPGGSLSVSGARRLLPPSCPARFRYERDHPPTPKREYDLGHAAHLKVLGKGPELVVVDAADWRTKAAKEARDLAHACGRVPLLPPQLEQVETMAAALAEHPIAGELLDPKRMQAEVSLFWPDPPTGVMLRARIDALSTPDPDGDVVIVDYKSCDSADLDHIRRAMHNFGYAMQCRWYIDGAIAVGAALAGVRFLFVFQEVDPPHLVTVVEPDETALMVGERRSRQAIEIYRDCVAADVWPGHTLPDEIPLVGVPTWVERQYATYDEEWM